MERSILNLFYDNFVFLKQNDEYIELTSTVRTALYLVKI